MLASIQRDNEPIQSKSVLAQNILLAFAKAQVVIVNQLGDSLAKYEKMHHHGIVVKKQSLNTCEFANCCEFTNLPCMVPIWWFKWTSNSNLRQLLLLWNENLCLRLHRQILSTVANYCRWTDIDSPLLQQLILLFAHQCENNWR